MSDERIATGEDFVVARSKARGVLDCPACKQAVEVDEAFGVATGTERRCPKCAALLVCTWARHMMFWTWAMKGTG